MKKNSTKNNPRKYGPTGILWALYLIVGVVAFLVSNFYFKFELKDAIIFGAVNLVVVVIITEGIDFIFKKVKLRQERKNSENEESEEISDEKPVDAVTEQTESEENPVKTDGEVSPEENLFLDTERTATPDVVEANKETEATPTTEPELPMLITGARGSGKNWDLLAKAVALQKAQSEATATNDINVVDTDGVESNVESLVTEVTPTQIADEKVTSPVENISSKPRGRRANPDAVIDAPTSSLPVITPEMGKTPVKQAMAPEPRVQEIYAPAPVMDVKVAEPVQEEQVTDEPYLSADEFLSTTKLTSPRAIVREYQRLGGKDDIFAILMERQK